MTPSLLLNGLPRRDQSIHIDIKTCIVGRGPRLPVPDGLEPGETSGPFVFLCSEQGHGTTPLLCCVSSFQESAAARRGGRACHACRCHRVQACMLRNCAVWCGYRHACSMQPLAVGRCLVGIQTQAGIIREQGGGCCLFYV